MGLWSTGEVATLPGESSSRSGSGGFSLAQDSSTFALSVCTKPAPKLGGGKAALSFRPGPQTRPTFRQKSSSNLPAEQDLVPWCDTLEGLVFCFRWPADLVSDVEGWSMRWTYSVRR